MDSWGIFTVAVKRRGKFPLLATDTEVNNCDDRFFLATNKTFEGVCLALAGEFLQKKL